MGAQIMVSARLLEWTLGRKPADDSTEPWEIRDVAEDGSAVLLVHEMTQTAEQRKILSKGVPVPADLRERALRLRHILVEAKTLPEVREGGAMIDFATEVGGDIGFTMKPTFYGREGTAFGRSPVKGLGRVPGKFKKRPRR